MPKRAERLDLPVPRYRYLSLPKDSQFLEENMLECINKSYLGLDGVFELLSGHSRMYNKSQLRTLLLNIIRGYGTNNHPNVNIRYYNSVRYSTNKTKRNKSLAETLIILSDIHDCDDDRTKQTKLRDSLIAFF